MTITLLAPDGVPVTAQQERQARAALYAGSPSRPLGGRSGFRPGTPMDTLTATSTTWTLKPCAAMIDPGATTHQGMYGWASDANITGSVNPADASNPRKDIVYIQVNDSTSGDGSGSVSYAPQYLAGPNNGSNVPPDLPLRSFLLGTISVPKATTGSPTVVLNTARFAAAGSAIHVFSAAERDGLDKFDGLTVRRMDVAGRPTETWDGAAWNAFKPFGSINGGAPTDLTAMSGTWARAFTTGPRRPRVWSTDGVTAHITGLVQYNGSDANILAIPGPYAPTDGTQITHVGASQASSAGSTSGGPSVDLGIQGGLLKVVYQSGSLPVGAFFPLHGSWLING